MACRGNECKVSGGGEGVHWALGGWLGRSGIAPGGSCQWRKKSQRGFLIFLR